MHFQCTVRHMNSQGLPLSSITLLYIHAPLLALSSDLLFVSVWVSLRCHTVAVTTSSQVLPEPDFGVNSLANYFWEGNQ